MGKDSKIQWTEDTWNPHVGCIKVSEGCKVCYMYREMERFGKDPRIVRQTAPSTFLAPLKSKTPRLIFTCSFSDFFIEEADGWRDQAWDVIRRTPHHRYQILTKRPERIRECLPPDWGTGWDHVWLGVTAENQVTFDQRMPILANIPAKVRFISAEPLLSEIDLMSNSVNYFNLRNRIHWVIIGGESGHNEGRYQYRPCDIRWINLIMNRCHEAKVPVFIKQLGTHLSKELKLSDRHGGNMYEWPRMLRVQKFPQNYHDWRPF